MFLPKTHPVDYNEYTKHHTGSHPWDNRNPLGCVYIIINPAWPEWIKIGKARKVDERCKGLQTSSPFRDYEVVYFIRTRRYHRLEEVAHKAIEKIAKERRNEWFKINIEEAKKVLDKLNRNHKNWKIGK